MFLAHNKESSTNSFFFVIQGYRMQKLLYIFILFAFKLFQIRQ